MACSNADAPARDNLSLDLMEPVRPHVDAYLLNWITSEPFRWEWFFEQRDGNCRLMGAFAVRLSETATIRRQAVAPIAEWVAKQFWSTTQKRAKVTSAPTHLTQEHRREARGVSSTSMLSVRPRAENLCRGCGESINARRGRIRSNRKLAFCAARQGQSIRSEGPQKTPTEY